MHEKIQIFVIFQLQTATESQKQHQMTWNLEHNPVLMSFTRKNTPEIVTRKSQKKFWIIDFFSFCPIVHDINNYYIIFSFLTQTFFYLTFFRTLAPYFIVISLLRIKEASECLVKIQALKCGMKNRKLFFYVL